MKEWGSSKLQAEYKRVDKQLTTRESTPAHENHVFGKSISRELIIANTIFICRVLGHDW